VAANHDEHSTRAVDGPADRPFGRIEAVESTFTTCSQPAAAEIRADTTWPSDNAVQVPRTEVLPEVRSFET